MTIAFGFRCIDGVIVAADRRITATLYTDSEEETWYLSWANGRAILAYAGNRDSNAELARQATLWFTGKTLSDEDIRTSFEDLVKSSIPQAEDYACFMGIWLDDSNYYRLRLINHKADGFVRTSDVRNCEVIGCADTSLARYLLARIRFACHFPRIQKAVIYAIQIISNAAKYDGQYVGGGFDVYTLSYRDDIKKVGFGVLRGSPELQAAIEAFECGEAVLFDRLIDREEAFVLNGPHHLERIKAFRKSVTGLDDVSWSDPQT